MSFELNSCIKVCFKKKINTIKTSINYDFIQIQNNRSFQLIYLSLNLMIFFLLKSYEIQMVKFSWDERKIIMNQIVNFFNKQFSAPKSNIKILASNKKEYLKREVDKLHDTNPNTTTFAYPITLHQVFHFCFVCFAYI